MCGLEVAEMGVFESDLLAELAFTLGAEVRELREGLGCSRSLLNQRSGTSQTWLRRLEDGNGVPSIAVLVRLAEAMGKRVWITLMDERDALPLRCLEGNGGGRA